MVAALYTVLAMVVATFVVYTAFMQVSSAKRALALWVRLPRDIRLVTYFWLIVGLAADVVFNATRGTLMFRELPRELLFTSRIKRHVRESANKSEWRYRKACEWRDILNAIDPGHIREAE